MGFGFLLFGYLFFSDFRLGVAGTALRFDVLPDVVGWVFLFLGCHKLKKWTRKFAFGEAICLVMLLPSAFSLLYDLGLWPYLCSEWFYTAFYPLFSAVLTFVFHYFLLFGVRDVAAGCRGQGELCEKLTRNFYITVFCFAMILAARIVWALSGGDQVVEYYTTLAVSICTLCYLIPNELRLLSAYQRITLG